MEYDNDENTWRRSSSPKVPQSTCYTIPRKSTTIAVIVLGLAILSCLFGYCVLSETLPYESKTLRLVIVLFRHGARTPTTTYKSDPFKNYQWPDGLGSLTNAGKLQLYELGKKYRNYYANFIPEEYCEKDVYIKSSDKSRCLMSAYTFLAGLYPPSERQSWHPEIAWQPIPVHSLPKHLDDIVAQTKPCKVWKAMYQELLDEMNASPQYAELFDYLSKYTNQSMRSILEVDFLYSTLQSQQEAGLKLPDWTKNVFPNKMRTPFMLSLALLSYNKTLQRLKVGPYLAELKKNLGDSVSHANLDRSLYLYSGHDVNVVALWRSLGFEELLAPDYGASLVLELHEEIEQDNFFVKISCCTTALPVGDGCVETYCKICVLCQAIELCLASEQTVHLMLSDPVGHRLNSEEVHVHCQPWDLDQKGYRLFYRNNTKAEVPLELNMPFCGDPCTYNRFIEHIDSLIPTEWEKECEN